MNKDSQKYLSNLKEAVKACLDDRNKYDCVYKTSNINSCCQDVRKSCDEICFRLSNLILKNYKQYLHIEPDELIDEILQHRKTGIEKLKIFYGRTDILNAITKYSMENLAKGSNIFVLHGQSGCGKTAIMAATGKNDNKLILYQLYNAICNE